MRHVLLLLFLTLIASLLSGKTLVFWQNGFPTVDSVPVNKAVLEKVLAGKQPVFADVTAVQNGATFSGVDLLVLPYGSAFPQAAWSNLLRYLRSGGNLLVIGGQPFRVPVASHGDRFTQAPPQDAYSQAIGIVHTYQVPQEDEKQFT